MENAQKLLLICLVTFLTLCIYSGYGQAQAEKDLRSSITGKWLYVSSASWQKASVEFFKEGTFVMLTEASETLVGDYRVLDNKTVRFDFKGRFGTVISKISILGDEMTLVDHANNVGKLIRAK